MEFPLGLSEIYSPRYFTTICNTCLVRFNFITYDNVNASSKPQKKNSYQKKILHVLIFFFLGLKTRMLNTWCVLNACFQVIFCWWRILRLYRHHRYSLLHGPNRGRWKKTGSPRKVKRQGTCTGTLWSRRSCKRRCIFFICK